MLRLARWAAAAAAVASLVAVQPVAAQNGVAGTWTLEFVRRVTNDGSGEQTEMGHARVVMEVHGDSVTANWQVVEPGPDGKPVPPRVLRGTVKDNHVMLTGQSQARINRNGDESTVTMNITYDLTVAGDDIAGVQTADSADGMIQAPARPIHGKREKAG